MKDIERPGSEQPDLFELLRTPVEELDIQIPQETDESDSTPSEKEHKQDSGTEGSKGVLPPEARRALVYLLRHGVIMAASKRLLFDVICRYKEQTQAHLADMYLRMMLDEQAGLAILLQQDEVDTDDEEDISSLISRRTLTLFDTLLLLVLRKHYQEREAAGEQRVIIDIERIEISLRPFLPLTNSSRSDRRQLSGALKNMKDRRILAAVRGEEDRFEITPVIRYVVNAAFLEQMLKQYQKLVERADTGVEPEGKDE